MTNSQKKDLQSANEVLSEMGFDRGAKQSTKAAFIKYLFKQAYGVDLEPPVIYKTQEVSEIQQLSFNFEAADNGKNKVS